MLTPGRAVRAIGHGAGLVRPRERQGRSPGAGRASFDAPPYRPRSRMEAGHLPVRIAAANAQSAAARSMPAAATATIRSISSGVITYGGMK